MLGIDVARTMIGWNENEDKSQIEEFLFSNSINGDISIDPTNIPWCSAFMNACERSIGNKGTGRLNARSWIGMGTTVTLANAQRGDIVIWDFEHDGTHGHVTYIDSISDDLSTITCLGGNQSNMVKDSTYNSNNLVSIQRTS
jgi:uncharacterized protein (TIGR02594 family)